MSNNVLTLDKVQVNTPVRVIMLDGSCEARERLHSMGIVNGATVKVITGGKKSNLLVAVENTRIALELKLAKSIIVQ